MPKYTNGKLEYYLKKDSKIIKKNNKYLKNSNILNYLSTLLGYKNYQEVTKNNDLSLIEISDLTEQEIFNFVSEYENSVVNKENITSFSSSLHSIKPVKTLNIVRYGLDNKPHKKLKTYDLSNAILKLNNHDYSSIIHHYIYILWKDDKETQFLIHDLFNLILDIMKVEGKNIIQKEIHNHLSPEELKISHNKMQNIELEDRIENIFWKKENLNILFSQFKNIIKHPYLDLSNKDREIIVIDNLKDELSSFNIRYDDYRLNYELSYAIFNLNNNTGYKTKEIPLEYREALLGFKQQAGFATRSLNIKIKRSKENLDRNELKKAHSLLSKNETATKHIYKMLRDGDINIDRVNDELLFKAIQNKYSLYLTHLQYKPLYYLAFNEIKGVQYYFITMYYGDAIQCGGHSSVMEISIEMQNEMINEMINENQLKDIKKSNKIPEVLLNSLIRPDLATNVFYAKKSD